MKTQADYEQRIIDITEDVARDLQKNTNNALALLDKFKDQEIGKFMCRFLDLHETRNTVLYRTFGEVISFDDYSFIGNLCSFVNNFLLDDSYFVVEWRRDISDEGMVEFDENGDIKYQVVDEKTECSYPVIVSNGDGIKDAKVLIEIMDYVEKQDIEFEKTLDEFINGL
jgi:hypothetical protein